MKMNQILAVCGAAAALVWGAANASAQDNNGGGGNGGPGGGGWRGRGGGFDPQMIMDRIRDRLEITNDTDWSAIQPLVQKVWDARRDASGMGNMRLLFQRRNRGGENGDDNRPRGGGGFGGQPSPEAEALQSAIDNNAPSGQIKDLLARYRSSQKAKQSQLKSAQENLRNVLTVKQEAEATLLGLLD